MENLQPHVNNDEEGVIKRNTLLSRAVPMLLLLVMFASGVIWFIMDVFVNKSRDQVATIGRKSVSIHEFEEFVPIFSAIEGGNDSDADPGSKLAIRRAALDSIVFNKMVDMEMSSSGFVVADDIMMIWIKERVRRGEIPLINSIEYLEALIKNNPKALKYIIDGEKRILFLGLNFGSFSKEYPMITKDFLNIFLKSRNERRIVDVFILPKNKPEPNKYEPSRDELLDLYQQNKEVFRQKKGRKVLFIDSSEFKDIETDITNQDVEAYYLAKNGKFLHKRDVIVFSANDKSLIDRALFELERGTSIADVKKIQGIGAKSMQSISRSDLDPSVVDIVFSTKIGQPSPVLRSQSGDFILFLTERIHSHGHKKPSKEQEGKIIKVLKEKKRCEIVMKKQEYFKRMVINGANLRKIAGEFGSVVKELEIFDTQKNTYGLEDEVLNAMKLAKGNIPDFVKKQEGGCDYIFFEVDKIFKDETLTFKEARDMVLKSYISNKEEEELKKSAASFVAKIKFYTSPDKVDKIYAVADAVKAEKKLGLVFRRGNYEEYSKLVPQSFFDMVFVADKKSVISEARNFDGFYVVGYVSNINHATKENVKSGYDSILTDFQLQYRNDFNTLYNKYLRNKYKVTVNEEYLRKDL